MAMSTQANKHKKKLLNLSLKNSLPEKIVNISEKKRSNLFTWRGQFSPQLIEALITNYAKDQDRLLDPFLGSGTLLLEAAVFDLSAYGVEVNPAAFGLASIYRICKFSNKQRKDAVFRVKTIVNRCSSGSPDTLFDKEAELVKSLNSEKGEIEKIVLEAFIIGLDIGNKKLTKQKVLKAWESLESKILGLPFTHAELDLDLGDARKTKLEDSTIDLVITSPPYINVFNYHQNYRKSTEAIGYDVLKVARSEIGSNRKFRSNRFLTVVQYALDISEVLEEVKRVVKDDAKIIFIVGRESSVKKTSFSNAALLTEVANIVGFKLEGEQPRVFKNKFGKDIYEEILRFSVKQKNSTAPIEEIRKLAVKHLKKARNTVPKESREDLDLAIERASQVSPSPLYKNK